MFIYTLKTLASGTVEDPDVRRAEKDGFAQVFCI